MLLTARQLDLHVGTHAILDQADLVIEPRERVCLVGRNGAGKSTLLKLIAGEITADGGEIDRSNAPIIATLPQEVPQGMTGAVYDVVAAGLGEAGQLVADYHHVLATEPENLNKLAKVQQALEAADGWTLSSRVDATLSRLSLDGSLAFESLSGGLKRRVLLAQALVTDPDLLLLDEPTNHLDIDSIRWLEEFLLGWDGTLLFITHDRAFLKRLATRIIELDRGRLTSWPGTYEDYLRRKAEALEAEAQQNALFDKKLAQEETWIRQGIKARRTRNEGRVRALKALRAEYQQRRTVQGTAKIAVEEAERSGKLVTEVTDLRYAFGDLCIVDGLTTTILRGDKIGVLGPNGVGKTTLLRLMLGQLQPDAGTVELGTKLEIAVFDQLRDQLDPTKTVVDHIGDGKETVTIGGKEKHVISYLADFLFPPDRARSPVRVLSGGERSRLMLARLFSRPSNLMILDEPTNDLDVETLELLEERLIEYAGTVIVVSHDRAFVDNVVTRTLAFEGGGRVGDYVGGYEDWLRQRVSPKPRPAKSSAQSGAAKKPAAGPKRSYKVQKELDELPARIETLERRQAELAQELQQAYESAPERVGALQSETDQVSSDLVAAYARWEALEG
ncbi:ATP-binding cassette domain-containing protein [Abyssibacter sp.]|uniref:ATP-binding cassette domain-containing protein n=1 Tax=Abyssibacter sp. TaxID=2320200 RepID=UPI0025BBF698|nr:ATP-binding cassette domain-containing protein [Abyssibacter sp.]MCK5858336.1 ATP-binding cassette domain-containing protein [Abyssibacter sp.]